MVSTIQSLIAAFLFGISTVLDRVAIASVTNGALVYSAYWNLITTLLLVPILYSKGAIRLIGHNHNCKLCKEYKRILLYAVLTISAFIFQQFAVQYSLSIDNGITYVKSVVMTHISFVALFSIFFLKEKISYLLIFSGVLTFLSGIGLILSVSQ
jgi:hypothetical protein